MSCLVRGTCPHFGVSRLSGSTVFIFHPPSTTASPQTDGLEGEYSLVDMTKLRDKGPEIAVVSEEGRRAPLHKVEEELDKHGGDFVASRSILDTVSILGLVY